MEVQYNLKVPVHRLTKVIQCSNYPVKKTTDNSKWYKQTIPDLQKFLKDLPKDSIFKAIYTRRNTLDYGRLISNGTIQYWTRTSSVLYLTT